MAILKRDITQFLEVYHNFKLVHSNNTRVTTLRGVITIVDTNSRIWANYNIRIEISFLHPYAIPIVYEESKHIERNIDFHISEDGECCLDIHHDLLLKMRKGINLIDFYQNDIYPFFANHQYRINRDQYANGEYEHYGKGIIQYYREKIGLSDHIYIIKLISLLLSREKQQANKACKVCGSPKFKKCCRPNYNKLRLFGMEQLKIDLEVFNKLDDSE